jgi:hypothetical protein
MWPKNVAYKIGTSFSNYARDKAINKAFSDTAGVSPRGTHSFRGSTSSSTPQCPIVCPVQQMEMSVYIFLFLPVRELTAGNRWGNQYCAGRRTLLDIC